MTDPTTTLEPDEIDDELTPELSDEFLDDTEDVIEPVIKREKIPDPEIVELPYPLTALLNENIEPHVRRIGDRAASRFIPEVNAVELIHFTSQFLRDKTDEDRAKKTMFRYGAMSSLHQYFAAIWRHDDLQPKYLNVALPNPLTMLLILAPNAWKMLEAELSTASIDWEKKHPNNKFPHKNLLAALQAHRS